MKDLIILVADKNTESALLGLLRRPDALGIREVQFDIRVHPQRDPGVYRRAHEFLRPFIRQYRYALVLLDREGSGAERVGPDRMRSAVQERLERSGWEGRCSVIVLDPELETWVWLDDPHVAQALRISLQDLRNLLREGKPPRPKETLEDLLKERRTPRSSSLYEDLASQVDFRKCADPAFRLLRETLQRWFGNAQNL